MRVLLISTVFPPGFDGGYELGALDVANSLHAKGHIIRVLTSDFYTDDQARLTDFPIVRALDPARTVMTETEKAWRWVVFSPGNLRRIGSELIAFRPHAVLIFSCAGLGVLGMLRYLVSVGVTPAVFLMDNVFQGLPAPGPGGDVAGRVFGGLDFLDEISFIVMSQRLQSEVEATLRRALKDAVIVPGWPDPTIDYATMTLSNDAPGDNVRFVFTSSIGRHKGIEILILAARQFLDQGQTNFTLDIFGAGATAELRQIIVALGLTRHVFYRGTLPKTKMTRQLANYDALLFPTMQREPFGFVVAEAAAAGCIPVMTAGIGAGEWFSDGIDCFKIQRDFRSLTDAMLRIARMPRSDREAMRQRSREASLQQFSFDDAMEAIQEVLDRVVQSTSIPDSTTIRGVEAALSYLGGLSTPAEPA